MKDRHLRKNEYKVIINGEDEKHYIRITDEQRRKIVNFLNSTPIMKNSSLPERK